jgi:ABC-type transport system substrate-binding protein
MAHPPVGGYPPENVALRRAIGLGMDVERQIRIVRGGQGIVAQSPITANITGYDPAFRSENGEFDRARANALLDVYGYKDRTGDGWRERPDGSPLLLTIASEPQDSRLGDELTRADLQALGLKVRFAIAQWPENAKAAQAGTLMMWQLGYGAVKPDGLDSLERVYGPAAGAANLSRFDLPAMNALYERMLALPDGPEREALFDQAKRIAVAYMPEKTSVHRLFTYLNQPWLVGYRRKPFQTGWYQMVDVEPRMAP